MLHMDKKPLYKDEQVLDFIPQRAPFVLVDTVYEMEEKRLVTGFDIPQGHVLIEEGKLMSVRHRGFWAAMDTFKDKKRFDDMCSEGNMPWAVWNGTAGAAKASTPGELVFPGIRAGRRASRGARPAVVVMRAAPRP